MARCAAEAVRRLLGCLLIWLGGAAFADTGCLRAIEGSPTDRAAAARLVFNFHEIPGYPYAVFAGFPLRSIRDGPRLVQPDDAVVSEQVERLDVPWNGVSATGYVLRPLFRIGDTWMLFDGTRFVAAPALGRDETGPYPRWTQWGERLFLLDRRGWWEVRRDLTLTPGDLPVTYRSPLDVELEVSAIFGAVFAGRRGQGLWVSRDGLTFAQVDTGNVPVR
ncbi:hypothetical protein [Roseovarius confluentis]|uniref:hypothetical protein n=1 Tax=Roseovarius confluentis TaxID=1852027 RepID=UPI000CDD8B56|nr:hypothetical protein [Roseovarius confluentis]